MKKRILLFLLGITLLMSKNLAQINCAMEFSPSSSFSVSPPSNLPLCADDDVCSNLDNDKYIPYQDDDRDLKTIRINFHIMQATGPDPQNFTEEDIPLLEDIVDFANNPHLNPLNLPVVGGVTLNNHPFVEDSKLQFELTNIYFHQDNTGLTNGNSISASYCWSLYRENEDCELNVFFCEIPTGTTGIGQGFLGEGSNYVILNSSFSGFGTHWTVSSLAANLIHEVGHCLGLLHPWQGPHPQGCNTHQCTIFPDLICPNSSDFCSPNTDPNCTNNFMAYGSFANYFTPLQLGHMHRLLIGSWRTKELLVEYDPSKTITISSDETWEQGRVVYGDIIVEPEKRLTIKCKVIMPPGGKIIVKPRGELYVDEGLITLASSKCSDYWEGIEAWGNSSASQFPSGGFSPQGYVRLKNATIEYANTAVKLYDPSDIGGSSGGYVLSTGTTFLNCKRSFDFRTYQNTIAGNPFRNLSHISACTFTIDDDYTPFEFNSHAYLFEVDGIPFIGCTFEDARSPGNYPKALASKGIQSLDAHFVVSGGSTFNKLYLGIEAGNASSVHNFQVNNSNFSDNFGGIVSRDVDNFSVRNCGFIIGGYHITPTFITDGVGLSIQTGTGFAVRENTFNGNFGTGQTFGVYSRNTGAAANEIYNNDFDGLTVGNYANGNNINTMQPTEGGLQFKCNENPGNNSYDFYVDGEGVSIYQGGIDEAAGNKFSLNTSPSGSDFTNNSVPNWPVNYFFYELGVDEEPINISPFVFTDEGNENDCGIDIDNDDLDSLKKENQLQFFNQNQVLFQNKRGQYQNLLDGGDTDALLQNVQNVNTFTKTVVKTEVLSYAPYISEQVLEAVADKSNVFSNQDIMDIMLANTDPLRKGELLDYVKAQANLSSQQEQQLKQASNQSTQRNQLESEISYYHSQMQRAGNYLLIDFLVDSTDHNLDSIRFRLKEQESLEATYRSVESYLQESDTSLASIMLSGIPSFHNLSPSQLLDYAEYDRLKQIQFDLIGSNRTLYELNSAELLELEDIAVKNEGKAGAQSKHILNLIYGHDYLDIPEIPGGSSLVEFPNSNEQARVKSKAISELISAWPNPAKDHVNFRYNIEKSINQGALIISDINGQVIKQFDLENNQGFINWNTKNLDSGIYIYVLKYGDQLSPPQKIVLTK